MQLHVRGESVFLDDLPAPEGCLEAAALGSTIAAGELVSLDASRALEHPDVLAVLTASDIPGENQIGTIIQDEPLVRALESGQLGGAALDVAPGEPLPADHALFTLPNVAMTPHTAGASQLRAGRNVDRFVRNLAAAQTGDPFEGVVDKLAGF